MLYYKNGDLVAWQTSWEVVGPDFAQGQRMQLKEIQHAVPGVIERWKSTHQFDGKAGG